MFWVPTAAVFITMLLAMVRGLAGPTTFDRILGVNMFATKTILLIAVTGFLFGRPEWLDLAVLYAIVNFMGSLVVLHYVSQNRTETGSKD